MRHSQRKRKPIPLYMVDTINAFKATGRLVIVFPFVGKISISGAPGVSYEDAYRQMSDFLGRQVA